jgi:heme exporter protein A
MNLEPTKLKIARLSCERDYRLLFDNLSFTAESGSIFRVAGKNGAGKTTLLRTIAGLFEIQEGEVLVGDRSISEARHQILYIGHRPQLTGDLRVLDNLKFLTGYDDTCLKHALDNVGMLRYHDSLVKELSQGQGRRCALSRLWCSDAPIWILDEPYTALDVAMINTLDEKIGSHVASGGICLFTTHQPPTLSEFRTLELGCVD